MKPTYKNITNGIRLLETILKTEPAASNRAALNVVLNKLRNEQFTLIWKRGKAK